jgi:hypothetical protein
MENKISVGDKVRVKNKGITLSENLELYEEMVVVSYQLKAYPEDTHRSLYLDQSTRLNTEIYTGKLWCKSSFGGKETFHLFNQEELILCS